MINTYFEQQIKEKFGIPPTFEQEKAIKMLSDYLISREEGHVFVLKGHAGSGKSTLIAALVKTMVALKQRVMLMAPTGRAAKVFSQYAQHPCHTIHRRIYREKSFQGLDSEFSLNFNKYAHTTFIVDEASMIANSGGTGNTFGTGRLLDDLISYVFSAEGCKLILLGDDAQLPPIGEESSPALQEQVLATYGLKVQSMELTQVVRQSATSGILHNAVTIRRQQKMGLIHTPQLQWKGFTDIMPLPGHQLIEALSNSYHSEGLDDTIVICRSNKRANLYNNGIRNQILDREELLASGDRVMIAKNNYFWTESITDIDFIANGDMAVVRRVRKIREMFGFHFADVCLLFPDYNDLELEATVLLDTLQSEAPALSNTQSEVLFSRISEDYADIPLKKDRMKAIRSNPYYNALQIKYAYAVTCHKSQGGQWSHVYLDQAHLPPEYLSADYLHWLYTAFTRATGKLFLVNWPTSEDE